MQPNDEIELVISLPSTSDWLKTALATAIERDPVDASNDAEALATLLGRRANRILKDQLRENEPTVMVVMGLDMSRIGR